MCVCVCARVCDYSFGLGFAFFKFFYMGYSSRKKLKS